MKYVLYLSLILFVALTVVACSKKDDDSPEPKLKSDITGVWNCTEMNYTGTSVTEFMGQSLTTENTGEGYNINFTITFTENPNEVTTDGSYDTKLTMEFYGQTTTQYIEGETFKYTGTWSLDGDKLSISQNGQSNVATITELTDSRLEIKIHEETTETQNGATANITVDMTVAFER